MSTEHDGQRHVAGLWCGEVLQRLPNLVDGTLSDADRAQVIAHVSACDWCERFGGAYGAVVAALPKTMVSAPDGLIERLRARLAALPAQD
jgi:anti-sigma factor RsiW